MSSVSGIVLRNGLLGAAAATVGLAFGSLGVFARVREDLIAELGIRAEILEVGLVGLVFLVLFGLAYWTQSALTGPLGRLLKGVESGDTAGLRLTVGEYDAVAKKFAELSKKLSEQENDSDDVSAKVEELRERIDELDAERLRLEAELKSARSASPAGLDAPPSAPVVAAGLFEQSKTLAVESTVDAEEEASSRTLWLGKLMRSLRSPVVEIKEIARKLLDTWEQLPQSSIYQSVGDIERVTGRQLESIDRALRQAKESARAAEPQLAPLPLGPFLGELSQSMTARLKGSKVRWRLQSELEDDALLETDEAYLREILQNLLDNAVQHTDSGEIVLFVEKVGYSVLFSVVDTGVGISEEHKRRVFEHFYQASDRSSGAGLGLAIAKSLAKGLGGNLTVSSRPNAGSRFVFEYENARLLRNSGEEQAQLAERAGRLSESVPPDLIQEVRRLAEKGRAAELSKLVELRLKADYPEFAAIVKNLLFNRTGLLAVLDSIVLDAKTS